MANHPIDPEITKVRRANKEVTDERWIKEYLHKTAAGVLATAVEEQPFLSPKLFVFDEQKHAIFFHSANSGRVWTNVHLNPNVCFSAYEMGRIIPADKSCGFGFEYSSVIVFGKISVVEDKDEAVSALRMFMQKFAPQEKPGKTYALVTHDDVYDMAVYRLDIEGWSGKQDKRTDDLPGAYRYEEINP